MYRTSQGERTLLGADQRQELRPELGIEEDYYLWIPPDPTDDSAARMLAELQHLTPEGRGLGNSPPDNLARVSTAA